ncbi:MAG: NAD(P)-dependent oxidoreductase [Cytophagales bacterium]|nr:NAD(P)-dependent oxidoreductase [Armatimonadota bacterium]
MTIANESRQAVSVIGLGLMGFTIARLLLGAGYAVTVWNRTRAKAEPLIAEGAILAPSAAAAVSASPITLICVYDYKATNAILETDEVAAALAGRILVQLTTGSPQEAREAEAWAHQHGAGYLDGAIQVAPDQMAQPDTTILLSGAQTALGQSEPILRVLGGNLTYLGEKIGAASAMDMATLSYLYGAILGFFHGALICEAEGFDVGAYGAIIARVAPGFGEFLKHEGTVIQTGDYAVSQSPLRISTEATIRILQAARESRLNTDFPALVSGVFQKATAAGYGDEELAAAIKVLRQSA